MERRVVVDKNKTTDAYTYKTRRRTINMKRLCEQTAERRFSCKAEENILGNHQPAEAWYKQYQ